MQVKATRKMLIALLLASLMLAVTLPAGASPSVAVDEGPLLVDASHDEHGERCCLSELGGHSLCHVTAALFNASVPSTAVPAADSSVLFREALVTRTLPPILKPPIVIA